MNKWAKPELIDTWDNTGFQVGDENASINKILIALDLDRKVLDKAIEENYEMIISHHPLIFKPLNKITAENHKENLLLDLIKNNIVVYNAHSNLDLAHNGVSHTLANKLQMFNTRPIKMIYEDEKHSHGYGQIGEINSSSKSHLVNLIKKELTTDSLIIYGHIPKSVTKIAVCGGSGGDFILDAHLQGAQVYITGDIKYHDAQGAFELGLAIIDAGHYNTEKIILPVIKEYLNNNLKSSIHLEVIDESSIPYEII